MIVIIPKLKNLLEFDDAKFQRDQKKQAIIDAKFEIAKKAILNLVDTYKKFGKMEESDLTLEAGVDIYDIHFNVKKYKEKKGIK